MRPLLHRDPGIVGAALAHDQVIVSVIVDGIHLAPETVLTVWRAARERLALVSDAIARRRVADGPSSLGELDLQVSEGAVRGPDGVLAGSVLTMIEAVRNLHALGVPLEEAVGAATVVPAGCSATRRWGASRSASPPTWSCSNDRVEIERVLVGGDESRPGLAKPGKLRAMRPLAVRLSTHYLGALHRVLYRASGVGSDRASGGSRSCC